jgi:BirA family biotin operon repressor/biotin-[acetyl-CoA-carboxylase] ligase
MMEERGVAPDLADAAELVRTRGGALGQPLHLAVETGSTNDDAKAGAKSGAPHGAVWVAETQTEGRGRLGRSWISPPGENLLFSVLLRVACPPMRVPPIALVAGLAVRDAVARSVGDERVRVKWPNDVVVLGPDQSFRKIAGVLVESAVAGSKVDHVVVGIGVNVHTRSFPPELDAIATSIARESSSVASRAELLADILAALDHDVEHVAHRGLGMVHGRLSRVDVLSGRRVTVEDTSGIARGIDGDGRLVVERDDGSIVRLVSGEVRQG